jgi:outer membrane biosynthesis protein TonB
MKAKKTVRFSLILLVAGIFLTGPVFASTPASECASTLWQKFQGRIKYPDFAQKEAIQGEVVVVFTVSDDGKIIVKDIRSTDRELLKYIKEAMLNVKAPELDNASIYDFKVIFHFKLI